VVRAAPEIVSTTDYTDYADFTDLYTNSLRHVTASLGEAVPSGKDLT